MNTGTITSKGQTTIPKKVREALGLKPGDVLRWSVENGRAVVRAKTRSAANLKGMLPKPAKSLTLEEMDAAVAKAVMERDARSRY